MTSPARQRHRGDVQDASTKQYRPPPIGDRAMTILVIVCAAAVIVLQCASMALPSASNWGIHQLAFVPIVARVLILGAMAAVLFRPVSERVLGFLSRKARSFTKSPPRTKRLLLLAALISAVILFWGTRETTYLLGDGNLVARTLPTIRAAENIPRTSFQNEPLATVIVWNVCKAMKGSGSAGDGVRAYQLTSIFFGAASLLLIVVLVRSIAADPVERLLAGLAIFGAAGAELFFGYVESYAVLSFGSLLFITLSLLSLKNTLSPLVPSIAFGALLALHLGMASMFPMLLLLAVVSYRRDGLLAAIVSMTAAFLTAVFCFWISGYRAETLASLFAGGGGHLLPLARAMTDGEAYTLFSGAHLLDYANLLLLLSPFSLLAFGLAVTSVLRNGLQRDASWNFLLLSLVCGLAFTFTLNCELGMSRDWDLLSSFNMAMVMVVPVACAGWIEGAETRRRVLLIVCAITLLSSIPWIALNASEESALARFAQLPDRSLWSRNAFQNAYDELAAYHKEKKEYAKAIEYCGRYLESDSNNARIYGKMGELYGLVGDKEHELLSYGKSLQHGVKNWKLASYVGSQYASLGNYAEAIEYSARGLELNPSSADEWYIQGSYYVNGPKDYASGLRSFQKAIALDSTHARWYADAGRCSALLGDDAGMNGYFSRYARLSSRPLDAAEMEKLLAPIALQMRKRPAQARP